MAFKFSVLSLERTKDSETINTNRQETMVKKQTTKQKAQRKKFSKAVSRCHKKTTGTKSFGRCMAKELKK